MSVRNLLKTLGQNLAVCGPEDTIYVGAAILTERGIGALPVCEENGCLVGIISERDIVHAYVRSGCGLQGMRVRQVMTTEIVSCEPHTSLEEANALMRDNGIRHLPVLEGDKVLGFISIRDLLNASFQDAALGSNVLQGNVSAFDPNRTQSRESVSHGP